MMKTLGKQITRRFFATDNGFELLEAEWGTKWQDKTWRDNLEPLHFFLYAALRGKDWRKGFTPITNETKLANGQRPMQRMEAIYDQIDLMIRSEQNDKSSIVPFDNVTVATLRKLRKFLPERKDLLGGPSYVDRTVKEVDEAA